MLTGFGAAGSHQDLTVFTCNIWKHIFERTTSDLLNFTPWSHPGLGDNPNQTDTESSFNQCYPRIFSRLCQYQRPGDARLYLFPQTLGSYGKPTPASGHCEAICFSVRQEAGKQEMCQAPGSHPNASKEAFYYLKSCGGFQKIHCKYKTAGPLAFPTLSVWSKNKRDYIKTFPRSVWGEAWPIEESKVWRLWGQRKSCDWTLLLFHHQHIFPLWQIT